MERHFIVGVSDEPDNVDFLFAASIKSPFDFDWDLDKAVTAEMDARIAYRRWKQIRGRAKLYSTVFLITDDEEQMKSIYNELIEKYSLEDES